MKKREYHGLHARSEYRIWGNIVQRCCNPNNPNYDRYGARGIAICPEWRQSFLAFFGYIGPRPSAEHSVDRKDNARGYEPGNVRWATPEEQAQNQSTTLHITAFGETKCLAQWSRDTGVPMLTIWSRLTKFGWLPERALAPSKQGRFSHANLSPEQLAEIRRRAAGGENGKELARAFGISHTSACRAISGRTYGESFDRAIALAERATS